MLLSAGCSIYNREVGGKTPLDAARRAGYGAFATSIKETWNRLQEDREEEYIDTVHKKMLTMRDEERKLKQQQQQLQELKRQQRRLSIQLKKKALEEAQRQAENDKARKAQRKATLRTRRRSIELQKMLINK